jgi:GT2 family glycosyltransferase
MITIVYSTHKDEEYNKKFKQHILDSVGLKDVQIIEFINHNTHSLSQVYNYGIEQSKFDIVVCCHNDIHLEKGWGKKLLSDFSDNPEFGIIGKAGSCYFPESGVYWEKMFQTMVGQVYHQPEGQKKFLSKYSPKLPFLIPVVTIDGLFISFNKNKIKHRFDESIGRFHFYDHLFCVPNYLDGVKIGVTSSFEITHQSIGRPNQEFFESKEKFLDKWKQVLPLDLKPNKIYVPDIKEKPIKNIGKVAIIIPTKSKVEMLFDCVKSFFDHCNKDLFDIFIADTGSNHNEKTQIKEFISSYDNVKLIEYDYYNFAKINNDVVKNHIGEEFEFLLFSNNDIKVMNNVIYGMLQVFKQNSKTGTVGCRLHFSDNTIQHDGIFMVYNTKNSKLDVSHVNLTNYYNFKTNLNETFGNTGGLLMIRKSLFEKLGLFNENYISCFEDVELNCSSLSMGFKNFTNSECVAYHYESQTRDDDSEKLKKLHYDFSKNLLPFINNNWSKLNNKILKI